jgi:hypothetical protein
MIHGHSPLDDPGVAEGTHMVEEKKQGACQPNAPIKM